MSGAKSSAFRPEPKGEAYAIYDPRRGAYLWRDGEEVRLDKRGDPDDPNAQWLAEDL